MAERLLFVGPGRMGLALGHALWQAEVVEELVYCGRRPEPPSHPLFIQGIAEYVFGLRPAEAGTTALVLSVPDQVVPEMAAAVAAQGEAPGGCAAFHLSGALGSDVLTPLHRRGYAVGSLHPLQAISNPLRGADRLHGSTFAVSGEPAAVRVASRLVSALGSPTVQIPRAQRPLYHAAAVTASNHLVSLLSVAVRMLLRAGLRPAEAERALVSLAEGTLANLREGGVEEALSGPVSRGDTETVLLHLRVLEGDEREIYRLLGREAARLATEHGAAAEEIETMEELLEER